MYRSTVAHDVFTEFDRLQRAMAQGFDARACQQSAAYPTLSVAHTPQAVEIEAFAAGLDPATLDVQVEAGLLTIAGERTTPAAPEGEATKSHLRERFTGRFRRVLRLPDDADPAGVSAQYRDGVLQVSVRRKEAAQPRRIVVQ